MSTPIFTPISLLLALFVLGAVILTTIKFGNRASTLDFRPVHRHWALRICGALLALGIFIALGIGTWTTSHTDAIGKPITVLAPSLPVPPLPDMKQSDRGEVVVPPCRMVATLVLARVVGGEMVPLAAESKLIDWPAMREQELSFAGNHAGADYSVRISPNDFGLTGRDSGLALRGRRSTECKSFDSRSSSSGGWVQELEAVEMITDMNNHVSRHAALSLLPRPREMLYLMLDLRRADAADPLQPVAIDGWMRQAPDDVMEEWRTNHLMDRRNSVQAHAPPGVKLLAHLGPSSLLLLLAAVAGSQAFRYRGRAMAGLLAAGILFAGTMEHFVWRKQAAIARDAAHPMTTRLLAAEGLSYTFFHPARARAELQSMLDDASLPAGLQTLLRTRTDRGNASDATDD